MKLVNEITAPEPEKEEACILPQLKGKPPGFYLFIDSNEDYFYVKKVHHDKSCRVSYDPIHALLFSACDLDPGDWCGFFVREIEVVLR